MHIPFEEWAGVSISSQDSKPTSLIKYSLNMWGNNWIPL